MKAALLLVAAASIGAAGCTNGNDISLSIIEMQAITRANQCVAMPAATGSLARDRGLLDISKVTTAGYIAVPVVRNNLLATTGVEFNSIQLQGANIKLSTAAGMPIALPNGQTEFFYASAGGRLDPAGVAPMFIEVVSADLARSLAPNVPATGYFTISAEVRPVGMRQSDQVVGGPMDFPIDLCNGCLTVTTTCPLPKGTMVVDPCFVQQDDATICCTDTTGALLCGGSAPVAM